MVNKQATRYFSSKQEKAVAKAIGGRKTANSGATDFIKGDVLTEDWLIECKTCVSPKSSFSIRKEWLTKNKQESIAMQKGYNALAFDFGDGKNYYIVDERIFKEMVNMTKEEK